VLSNVYLDRFDHYVERELIPTWTKEEHRRKNPAYVWTAKRVRAAKRRGQREQLKGWRRQLRRLPSLDPHDPTYRRLRYVRYADDWLLGFNGTRAEAEGLKQTITAWLKTNLRLTLSEEKTLVTHATRGAAHFLGYEVLTQQSDNKLTKGRRSINGSIGLRVPRATLESHCRRYLRAGKPTHRTALLEESDFSIVARYQQEYRGLVQYYLLAVNVSALRKLHWIMRTSLLKTLARKHRTRVGTMRRKYQATIQTPEGKSLKALVVRVEREGREPLIAQFGGIPLTRQPGAVLTEAPPTFRNRRTEILTRLLADTCELCGAKGDIEVHHIRKLKDLRRRGGRERPPWVKRMAALRRKTLMVCGACHRAIHAGRPVGHAGSA
jgi:hypothetical protein